MMNSDFLQFMGVGFVLLLAGCALVFCVTVPWKLMEHSSRLCDLEERLIKLRKEDDG